jgi:hypothetical protein
MHIVRYIYIKRGPVEIQATTYWNLTDRSMTVRPVACVIAQHYAYATVILLCFHSRKEKFSSCKKCYYFNLFYFLKYYVGGVMSVQCWTVQCKLPILLRVTSTSIAAISGRMCCSSSAVGLCLSVRCPEMMQP